MVSMFFLGKIIFRKLLKCHHLDVLTFKIPLTYVSPIPGVILLFTKCPGDDILAIFPIFLCVVLWCVCWERRDAVVFLW